MHFIIFTQTMYENLWLQVRAATVPVDGEKKMSCLQLVGLLKNLSPETVTTIDKQTILSQNNGFQVSLESDKVVTEGP